MNDILIIRKTSCHNDDQDYYTIYFQDQMENQPGGGLSAKSVDGIPLLFGPGVVLKFGARHRKISNAKIIFPLAFKYAQTIVEQEPVCFVT